MDRPFEVGAGVRSNGWWGLAVGLGVIGTALATLVSSYFFLMVESEAWPPPGIEPPRLVLPVAATSVLAVSILVARSLLVGARAGRVGSMRTWAGAAVGLGAAFLVLVWLDLAAAGFGPATHAYGSLVFLLGGFLWVLALAGVILAASLHLRLYGRREAARDLVLTARAFVLYWGFVVGSWVLVFLTVYLTPHVTGGGAP